MGQLDDAVRQRLTTLRVERRFTQQQIGEAVGWTQTSVSKYEHGDFSADLDTLVRFADFYDVPFVDLISPVGPRPPADPKRQQLLDVYGRLTEAQRDALLVMLGAVPVEASRPSGAARRSLKRTPATRPPRAGRRANTGGKQ